MSGWTPGPWLWDAGDIGEECSDPYSDIYAADGETTIAEFNDRIPEGRANANLMAAAPDLYEALQSMLTFYGMDREKGEVSDVIHAEAEKALAKARGEGDES